MPSNAVKEGRTQVQQLRELLQDFLGVGSNISSQGRARFDQFLEGTGIFANPLFGAGGTEAILGRLQNLIGTLPTSLDTINVPWQLQGVLNNLGFATDRANDILGFRGQTAESQFLRDRLTEQLLGVTANQTALSDMARSIMGTGGLTPQLAQLQSALSPLLASQGMTPALQQLQQTGLGIVSSGGRTADTARALQQFAGIIGAGGRDAGTQNLVTTGQSIVNRGGMTDALDAIMQQAQQGLTTGGFTPETRALMDEVMQLVQSRGAVDALDQIISQDQLVSFARDAAATAIAQRAEQARREAIARSGGAIAAGTTGQAMAEFADEAARAEAEALRNAVMQHQQMQQAVREVQAQRLASALSAGSSLSGTAANVLTGFQNLLGDVTRASSQNLATGAGLMQSGESIAAERLRAAIAGQSDVFNNELQRFAAGADLAAQAQSLANQLFSTATSGFLGSEQQRGVNLSTALNTLSNVLGSQQRAGSDLVNLLNTEFGREQSAFQAVSNLSNITSQVLAGQQQLGIDTLLKSLGMMADVNNQFTNQFFNAAQGVMGQANQWFNNVPSILGALGQNQAALTQAASRPGFWSQLGSGLLGGTLGALAGGLGDLLSRSVFGSGGQARNNSFGG